MLAKEIDFSLFTDRFFSNFSASHGSFKRALPRAIAQKYTETFFFHTTIIKLHISVESILPWGIPAAADMIAQDQD